MIVKFLFPLTLLKDPMLHNMFAFDPEIHCVEQRTDLGKLFDVCFSVIA